jgi:peptidoglycan-associated lipoprotein
MNIMLSKKAIAVAFTAVLFAGCSSTETQEGADVAPADSAGTGDAGALSAEELAAQAAAQAEAALRDVRTFYFDFDNSDIKDESKEALMAHARFLSANAGQQIQVEGHCDERGTTEYNMALGERRAKSVASFLTVNGASMGQIETISYGEERPAEMGQTEAAWAQNRRAVINYK